MRHPRYLLLTRTTLLVVSALVAPALAQTKGDLWETTSQMSMEGAPIKLPANTVKVCSFKEWKEPPGAADKQRNCKTSNMKTVGNKVTWDTACTGPTMTGTGELVREGTDAYTGTLKFSSAQGNMTIALKGKKVGECDNPQ
jgi:Protein of unknown function (DUF3617)